MQVSPAVPVAALTGVAITMAAITTTNWYSLARYWRLRRFARGKHALTSALAATEPLYVSSDRRVRSDRQTRQQIGGQHTEVAAPQTLDPYAFFVRHATSSTTSRLCSGLKRIAPLAMV